MFTLFFYFMQFLQGSTKEVILGTDNGQLFEIAVDEKDKREKYMKFLFELTELPEAFMGLQVFFNLSLFCFAVGTELPISISPLELYINIDSLFLYLQQ